MARYGERRKYAVMPAKEAVSQLIVTWRIPTKRGKIGVILGPVIPAEAGIHCFLPTFEKNSRLSPDYDPVSKAGVQRKNAWIPAPDQVRGMLHFAGMTLRVASTF